jgi:hypothetical protein
LGEAHFRIHRFIIAPDVIDDAIQSTINLSNLGEKIFAPNSINKKSFSVNKNAFLSLKFVEKGKTARPRSMNLLFAYVSGMFCLVCPMMQLVHCEAHNAYFQLIIQAIAIVSCSFNPFSSQRVTER